MTAIAGFWDFGEGGDPSVRCAAMLRSQALYGPHGSTVRSDGPIAIGRALFRILPEDRYDRGPATGGDGHLLLAADVRLDNRDALIGMLGISAGDGALLCDAAVMLRALERWGEEAVDRLVGDFAFAAWDARTRALLLARDFLGQRPLHYHRGGGFFAFASMPKGLHALPEIPRAANPAAAADFLALVPDSESATFHEGIEKVPPGHVVRVTREGIAARRYWRPPDRPLHLRTADDYAEALREQLDTAVAARLRGADGRVAAHLSAGLDSAGVTATAARLLGSGGGVVAFTAVPRAADGAPSVRGRICDEGPLAAETAALYANIEHVRIAAGGGSPLDALDRNVFLFERPVPNLCNLVWWDAINAEARARGLSVMLTGTLGNLTLSYAGMELLPQLLAQGRVLQWARTATALWRASTPARTVATYSFGPFLPAAIWRGLRRLRGRTPGLTPYSAVNPALSEALLRKAVAHHAAPAGRPRARCAAARLDALARVDPGNFNKGTLAGWGIDQRDPTTDRRLVEFCLSVPDECYLTDGVPRALARNALADRLPPAIVRERRKGYQAADWHEGLAASRESLREEIERLAACPDAAGTLDIAELRRLIRDWPSGGWNDTDTVRRYRIKLLRAVSAGHFLRRAAGTNG